MGKPLLNYTIEKIPSDIPITVSTNAAFADDFKQWKGTISRDIEILIEDAGKDDQKAGALGAIALWIKSEKIDDDILLLAGDNYVGCSMDAFLKEFRGAPLIAGHDIGSKDAARQFGTIVLLPPPSGEGGGGGTKRVQSFEEKPENPKSTIVSTGWWVLPKSSLPILLEYSLKHPDNVGGIFEEFLRRKLDVDCFVFDDVWKDIGSFDAYMGLHKEVVGDRTILHSAASADNESLLKGSIDIGAGVKIERSTLTDCIVFEHSVIKDCILECCIIDKGCVLEGIDLTDKMLRAGTVLRRK